MSLNNPRYSPTPLPEPKPLPAPYHAQCANQSDKPSGLAIAALVLGVISIVTWIFPGLLLAVFAVVFGFAAPRRSNGRFHGMAIAGFVTGGIALLFWGAVLFLMMAASA
jgi:hypothetical protein